MDSQPILVFPVPVSSPSSSNQIGNPTSFSPPSSIISRPPSLSKHSPISAQPEPTMASLAISFTPSRDLHLPSLSGLPMKPLEQSLANFSPMKLSLGTIRPKKANITKSERRLIVRAGYSDGGRQGGSSIFIGAFVLGGIIVGTLGCVYAPQISRALAGADKKDLMRKLPKFIYDEEKALEKTRKILAQKIEQLNSAIDDVSSQLRTDDDGVDGVSVSSVEEATV